MSCCCSLPPTCCKECPTNRFPGVGLTIGGIYNHPPLTGPIGFKTAERRSFRWFFKGGEKMVCVYFDNPDRGLDCTAKNCPCELYEVEE